MPLPHPPGYRPRLQRRVDRRRVLLAGLVFGFLAALLLGLAQRAAHVPSTGLPAVHWRHLMLVMLGAGFCGSFGETMRQLALVARTTRPQDSPPLE